MFFFAYEDLGFTLTVHLSADWPHLECPAAPVARAAILSSAVSEGRAWSRRVELAQVAGWDVGRASGLTSSRGRLLPTEPWQACLTKGPVAGASVAPWECGLPACLAAAWVGVLRPLQLLCGEPSPTQSL